MTGVQTCALPILQDYKDYHARQTMKMTHMDVFFYPIWEQDMDRLQQRRKDPVFVLFDYKERDPLTGEAAVRVVICNKK